MNTNRLALHWVAHAVAAAAFIVLATASTPLRADGPVPDPPIPAESVPVMHLASADREPDCRCAVLHARDIESRVDGHVERFEAQSRAPAHRHDHRARALHGTQFVEGVVGFPVRNFRLAADASDDGAGTP
jgi:hypothetical protein